MSAAGRGPRTGGPEDYFTTPSWTVRRLLDEWGPAREGPWVEPSAAFDGIARRIRVPPGSCPACHGTKRTPSKSLRTAEGAPVLVDCEACKVAPTTSAAAEVEATDG